MSNDRLHENDLILAVFRGIMAVMRCTEENADMDLEKYTSVIDTAYLYITKILDEEQYLAITKFLDKEQLEPRSFAEVRDKLEEVSPFLAKVFVLALDNLDAHDDGYEPTSTCAY